MATHSQHIHTFFPEISDKYRLEILKDLKKYSSLLQQSHLINNRWENLYLDPYRVPAVKHVFLAASVFARLPMTWMAFFELIFNFFNIKFNIPNTFNHSIHFQ